MSTMIFINVPVRDLKASMAYYKAQGFDHNPQFTDDTAACIVISDTIYVMVLTHEKFAQFSSKPIPDSTTQTGALYALSRDSREAVDQTVENGLAAGGTQPQEPTDYGFMYQRGLTDPDGNIIDFGWMDPAAAAQGPEAAASQQA